MRNLGILALLGFSMLIVGAPRCEAAAGPPRLLAARTDAFRPVPLEKGVPRFHIPPGSRLARNEHPRFLLTKEDLETLKGRLSDPRIAQEFQHLKSNVDASIKRNDPRRPPGLFPTALVWRLSGERKYIDVIRAHGGLKNPTWVFGWAAAIDLVWDDLTPGERRDLSDRAAKAMKKNGSQYWRPTLHVASVFYEGGGGPNDEFFLSRMKRDFNQTIIAWTDKLNGWAAGRGGSDMGHGYNGEHAYWEPWTSSICWAHATGEDYISRARFAAYETPFYFYHLVPDMKRLHVEKIGVTRSAGDKGATIAVHSGSTNLVWLSITRETDGLGRAYMDIVRSKEPAWGKWADAWGRLLWLDPEQKPLDYRTLPLTRLFPTSGHVIMRSDWTEGATFATFRCGRYGEIDGTWGRNNADNLSFTIRKNGPVAIDSGPAHGQNMQVLKFMSNGSRNLMQPNREYCRQTIAHNSITIGDKGFTHLDWRGQKTGNVVRRGGQSVCQSKDWWAKWGLGGQQKGFMEGEITAYCTHPLYDYVCGDALHSYPPGWVQEITRQFMYLKPDVFVVYDRIVVGDVKDRPCWMLHSLREPKATGAEKALTPDGVGPQLIADGRAKKPHPSPGGHFSMAGDGLSVESGSPGKPGGGWLRARTLWPAEADCERKKVGGRGHDFEVAGVQYGVTDAGYAMADNWYAVSSTIGLLGWRVELRPRKPSKAVEFLHVMQAGVEGAEAKAVEGVKLESTPAKHSVTIAHGGRTFVLKLNRTGGRGGEIRWPEGGGRMQIHMLPMSVHDHWRNYKGDANFKAWVTDPRYRVIIEPTDEERKLVK